MIDIRAKIGYNVRNVDIDSIGESNDKDRKSLSTRMIEGFFVGIGSALAGAIVGFGFRKVVSQETKKGKS